MTDRLTQELFDSDPATWRALYEQRLRGRAQKRKQRLATDPVARAKQAEQGRKWRAAHPDRVAKHNQELVAKAKADRAKYRTLLQSDSTGVN